VKADAIGLSALLVSTSKQMPLIVNELHRRDLAIPVLIGGAAINRRFGWRILYTEDEARYEPGVFYCSDAFEGLDTMEQLIDDQKRDTLLESLYAKASNEVKREVKSKKTRVAKSTGLLPTENIPQPKRWGPRIVEELPLESVFEYLYKNELFRLSWGAKNTRGEEWEKLKVEFEERLAKMKKEALTTGWLVPQGVYGFWPAQSDGDDLIVYHSDTNNQKESEEVTRFSFPRQRSGDRLCLADYFASVESGIMDVVAFQVVTVGQKATERFDQLEKAGDYSEAYFTHGLAVQTAEAAAEYLHRHVRKELGLSEGQGKRYSWGYPAIPNLDDHRKVFDLLPAEDKLGMSLTNAFQLVPEQSTAAIIVHHPQAKYYSTGESRVEQLIRK
jgi:5-methyltetrahydrofolate--homocysteine methyltransferase